MPIPLDFTKTPYFLKEDLKRTLPQLYKVEYDELWGLDPSQNFHNAIGDLPLGLEVIEAWFQSDAGQMAALYDGLSDDIPVVEVEFGKKNVNVAMFVMGMDYNLLQIEKYRLAEQLGQHIPSFNVIANKQATVGDYLNRRQHHTVLWGVPKRGIEGIFSMRDISTTDLSFQPYKKTNGVYDVTTHELFEFMKAVIFQFISRARISEPRQVEMILPPKLNERLVEIYVPQNGGSNSSNMTVKQMLMSEQLGLGVGAMRSRNELQGTELTKYLRNQTNTGMYPTNQDRIAIKAAGYNAERHFFTRRTFPPFQSHTLRFEQMTLEGTSGLMNVRTNKYQYIDYSNATA